MFMYINVRKFKILSSLFATVLLLYFTYTSHLRSHSIDEIKYLAGELIHKYFIFNLEIKETWLKDQKTFCDGRFVGYGSEFAVLKDTVYDPFVLNGQFKLICQGDLPKYAFKTTTNENHLNTWLGKMEFFQEGSISHMPVFSEKMALAVLRYDYANLYSQMTDVYNAFVVMKLLDIRPDDLDILFVDKNSPGAIDDLWDTLFGNVTFSKTLHARVKYNKLIWPVLGYNSPLNFHALNSLPYVDEFSEFVLSRSSVEFRKTLDCSKVSILMIWPKNYVAHPGNSSGMVKQKFQNEVELLESIEVAFPGHQVVGVQLDDFDLLTQINLISQTDILIGMHGAELSHVLFLPSHAAVLEFYPTYWSKMNRHFKAISRWKGLHYSSWQNINPNNEFEDFSTYVPVLVFQHSLTSLYYKMCGQLPEQSMLCFE